jgi:hypothetical protein
LCVGGLAGSDAEGTGDGGLCSGFGGCGVCRNLRLNVRTGSGCWASGGKLTDDRSQRPSERRQPTRKEYSSVVRF